jgi:hypothetical protein
MKSREKTQALRKMLGLQPEPTQLTKDQKLSLNTELCNSCGKTHKEVNLLIRLCIKTNYLICNECVEVCNHIIQAKAR